MRYWKGSIALSGTRDFPLLRQVLHSGFITHSQLFEFLRLDYCASSRNAFSNRVLRLVEHGLLTRHELPFINREIVYSVSETGASELAGKGEYHASSVEHLKLGNGPSHLHHSLELNEIHLALKRTGTLVYWTPETEIRSRNDLTTAGYWKYYDAVVVVTSLLGSLPLTMAEIPPERRAIQKLAAFWGLVPTNAVVGSEREAIRKRRQGKIRKGCRSASLDVQLAFWRWGTCPTCLTSVALPVRSSAAWNTSAGAGSRSTKGTLS